MLDRRVLLLLVALVCCCLHPQAASSKIVKVLPHYLDLNGRHSLHPSLFERDAYQQHLRTHPGERSALRFDIQWKAGGIVSPNLRLRLELRTSRAPLDRPIVLESTVKSSSWFSRWTALTFDGQAYKDMGDLVAWRATLWDGQSQLAEQKSFLW